MPPRLALQSLQFLQKSNNSLPPTFLLPFLTQFTRNASILAELSDTPGAYSHRIRRGRGPSSGKGKTSGRGHKGQKQHGKVPAHFNGGQTPDHIVSGHHGFKNMYVTREVCTFSEADNHRHAEEMSKVNLDRIQDWINQGRIDATKPITLKELVKSNAIHGIKDGVKLLARGATALTTPINVVVSRASASAIAAVEKLGGTVVTRYYTSHAIQRILKGKTDPYVSMKWDAEAIPLPAGMGVDPIQKVKGNGFQYRLPDPSSRKDLEYYRDPAKRGYLSHTRADGDGPSLFFKDPSTTKKRSRVKSGKKVKSENRLW